MGISSDHGMVLSPPRTPLGDDRRHLHTITGHAPAKAAMHSRQRDISDVGSPDRNFKAARRTETPKWMGRSRFSPPPMPHTPQAPGGITDRMMSRLDWPDVDDHQHTVDIGRVKSRGSARSQESVRSRGVRSLDRPEDVKTPDQNRKSPASIASQRSSGTPPLRRVDRSLSGDLRAASKRDRVKTKSLVKSRLLELDHEHENEPSPSTYDPVKDKGMAERYVSNTVSNRDVR